MSLGGFLLAEASVVLPYPCFKELFKGFLFAQKFDEFDVAGVVPFVEQSLLRQLLVRFIGEVLIQVAIFTHGDLLRISIPNKMQIIAQTSPLVLGWAMEIMLQPTPEAIQILPATLALIPRSQCHGRLDDRAAGAAPQRSIADLIWILALRLLVWIGWAREPEP